MPPRARRTNQAASCTLPGGALEMTFQLDTSNDAIPRTPPDPRRRTQRRLPVGDENTGAVPSPIRTRRRHHQEEPTPSRTRDDSLTRRPGTPKTQNAPTPTPQGTTTRSGSRARMPQIPVASSSRTRSAPAPRAERPRDLFDPDSDDEQTRSRRRVLFTDDDGETFNLSPPLAPPQALSPGTQTPSRLTPSRSPRARGTPRSGPHSPSVAPDARRAARGTQRPAPAGKGRSGADDVWTFYQQMVAKNHCLFCQQLNATHPHIKASEFSLRTSTGVLRKHLYERHPKEWISDCDRLNIAITAKEAQPAVEEYRRSQGQHTGASGTAGQGKGRRTFSHDAFVDAIVEFVVGDDQSINVIENEQLRAIFLMLREDLKDSDIPHRSTIRNRVMQLLDEYLDSLEAEIAAAIGKVSATMDIWTDQRLRPFMAVTGHWIEAKVVETPSGPRYALKLCSALIGFIQVPGHHDGEHLANAFLHVVDRIRGANKLGWVTLDNASNNDGCMLWVEIQLRWRGIAFSKIQRRVRCFPHIVHLACVAILKAITDMDFAGTDAENFEPAGHPVTTFTSAIDRDPIATLRALVHQIRASSLRRQFFSDVLKSLKLKDLELLRDVITGTRWSSTLLIDRGLQLRPAIDSFLSRNESEDLHTCKYRLGDEEWNALEVFKTILDVPHAFQQKLSAEKTPTLCNALPAFEAMISKREKMQKDMPEIADVIQKASTNLVLIKSALRKFRHIYLQ